MLLLDAGDLFARQALRDDKSSLQLRLAAETLVEAMNRLGYGALGLGEGDFVFGTSFLAQAAALAHFPLLSTSVRRGDAPGAPPDGVLELQLVDVGGLRVGLAAALSTDFAAYVQQQQDPGAPPLWLRPAADALRAGLAEMEGADLRILLAHARLDELQLVLEEVPGYDLVISGHESVLEPNSEPRYVGETAVVRLGYEGKRVGRLDLEVPPAGRPRVLLAQETLLDGSFADDPEMQALIERYNQRVADSLDRIIEDYPVVDPATGGSYLGTEACIDCHLDQHAAWLLTPHARAWETLQNRRRDYNPECFACHSTGFGYTGGFRLPDLTPGRVDVGCESCHGAGAVHASLPDEPYGRPVEEPTCRGCHTQDHSPEFDFAEYFPKVQHDALAAPAP